MTLNESRRAQAQGDFIVLIVGWTGDWSRTRELRNRRVETFEDGHFAPLRASRSSYGKSRWLAAQRSADRVSPMSCKM
jgi:hypothetical protein